MTTLGRTESALLVIDVQVGVVEDAYRREEAIAAVQLAVEKAGSAHVPVVWIQHNDEEMPLDSPRWSIVPELDPRADELHVSKSFKSSFEATDLETRLAALNIGHVYICGAQSDNCVRHTSHAALERGYDVTLVEDAHTTSDFRWDDQLISAQHIVNELNHAFYGYEVPGRVTTLVTSAELAF